MKTILFILLLLAAFSMQGQAPDLINYQAVAYNAAGQSINNTAISIRISILESSSAGTIVYQETHNPATDASGAFDIQIGGGSVQQGTFASIDWASHSHYLRVEMDATGGASYTIMGTSQMLSVPYAKYAETAGGVGGIAGELNGKVYYVTSSTVSPTGSCSPYNQFNFVTFVATVQNKIYLQLLGGSGLIALDYNPSTLAITGGSFTGISITGGNISSDFSTITFSFTDSGCTYTLISTQQ